MWRPCKAYMTVTYATRLNNPGTLKLNTKRPKTTEPENEKLTAPQTYHAWPCAFIACIHP